jgi:hypothetical protein
LRGLPEIDDVVNVDETISELDPRFRDINGQFSPAKWKDYIDERRSVVSKPRRLVPRTSTELDFIRLVQLVMKWCRYVELAELRVWPRNVDGSLPGIPWEQPHWRMVFMEAFWGGQAEIRDERDRTPR